MKLRAFLAFDIPDWVQEKLAALITDLRQYDDAVRWTDAGKFHVTVAFFGSVDEATLLGPASDRIATVVAQSKPVALECQGIGVFPNWKYPRVVWAGFAGETDPLLHLHHQLATALTEFGIDADERAFRLHLTLGRAKSLKGASPLVKRVESLGPISFGEVTVDQLVLYKSQLTKEGSIYTALKAFPLG